MFQRGKNCKIDTKFIIRDTVQYMGEHPEKQFIYLFQRQGRDTQPERSVGILGKERSKEVTHITLYRTVLLGLCLHMTN